MSKPVPSKPEPTQDNGYDLYLIPRSKTRPELNALYDYLLSVLEWRFDSHHMLWHTPEGDALQGFGRLEYTTDLLFASVQPPTTSADLRRAEPLIRLRRVGDDWMLA